jgi:hypothetical protein
MEQVSTLQCPRCNKPITADANYCAYCGRPLKDGALSISVSRQVVIYLISFFLAPFGLGYVWKYFKQGDSKSKEIALIALILTVAAIIVMFWTTSAFMSSYVEQLNGLGSF